MPPRPDAPSPLDSGPEADAKVGSGSELRARILQEATRLFAEQGYAGTPMREVVQAAGCTKPALYYHFGSKEGLFLACIRTQTDQFTAFVERGTQQPGPTMARMCEGLRNFLDHVRSHPTGIRLLWRAELHPEMDQPSFDFQSVRTLHMRMIRERLDGAQRQGEIRRELDLDDATQALVGMIDHRIEMWICGADLPLDLPERLLNIFYRGVAP